MFSRLTVAKFIAYKEPDHIFEIITEKWIGAGYRMINTLDSNVGGENCNEVMEDVGENMDIMLTTVPTKMERRKGTMPQLTK